MKAAIKAWLDANVWDGEDRSGCKNDYANHSPDDLQELVEDCLSDIGPKWVSADIPPMYGWYLVDIGGGSVVTGFYDGPGVWIVCGCDCEDVLNYMELPKPPERNGQSI